MTMHYQLKIHKLDGDYIKAGHWGRFECSHMSTARNRAIQEAKANSLPIVIERVTDGPLEGREGFERGRAVSIVKAVLVINPDGSSRPPDGVKLAGPVSECSAEPSGPPCFCATCRAQRKAQANA